MSGSAPASTVRCGGCGEAIAGNRAEFTPDGSGYRCWRCGGAEKMVRYQAEDLAHESGGDVPPARTCDRCEQPTLFPVSVIWAELRGRQVFPTGYEYRCNNCPNVARILTAAGLGFSAVLGLFLLVLARFLWRDEKYLAWACIATAAYHLAKLVPGLRNRSRNPVTSSPRLNMPWMRGKT